MPENWHKLVTAGALLPAGLFGDGVPVQGRMNQRTVDFWALNLLQKHCGLLGTQLALQLHIFQLENSNHMLGC